MPYRDVINYTNTQQQYDPAIHDETGFFENLFPSHRVFSDENTSISAGTNTFTDKSRRNHELRQLYREGQISDQVWDSARRTDGFNPTPEGQMNWDALASHAQKQYGTYNENGEPIREYLTNAQIQERTRDTLKIQRENQEEVASKANMFGVAGQIVGAFGGVAKDPINYAPLPNKVSRALIGLGWAGKIIRGALEAGFTEGLIQPFVYSYKADIGAKYTMGDALENIALGAGFGAGLSTVGQLAVKLNDIANDARLQRSTAPEAQAAREAIKELADDLAAVPDPKMPVKEYGDNAGRVEDEINEGVPMNDERFGEDSYLGPERSAEDEADIEEAFQEIMQDDDLFNELTIKMDDGQELTVTEALVANKFEEERLAGLRDCITG